jgi:hypothetical protein
MALCVLSGAGPCEDDLICVAWLPLILLKNIIVTDDGNIALPVTIIKHEHLALELYNIFCLDNVGHFISQGVFLLLRPQP